MTRNIFQIAICIFAVAMTTSGLWGQQLRVREFVDRFDQRFSRERPREQEELPDAEAFDEAGEPFELKQTRGKYTVFVFGCLT